MNAEEYRYRRFHNLCIDCLKPNCIKARCDDCAKWENARVKVRYYELKSKRVCTKCKKKLNSKIKGPMCTQCRTKATESKKIRRDVFIAEGRCARCGSKMMACNIGKYTRCKACRDKLREYRNAKKQDAERVLAEAKTDQ